MLDSMALAVLLDMADIGLYFLDMLTDIRVLQVRPAAISLQAHQNAAAAFTVANGG